MKRLSAVFSVYVFVGLMFLGLAGTADGQSRNEREVRDTVRSLNSKIDDFRYNLEYQLKSSSADPRDLGGIESDMLDLQAKLNEFQENLNQKRENRDDVSSLLRPAGNVDRFMRSNQQNRKLENDWSSIRGLLDRLANSYGVSTNWNNVGAYPSNSDQNTSNYPTTNRNNYPLPAQTRSSSFASVLTGTYQLDTSRSENTADIISRAGVSGAQRQDLESKIEAPEQIALDIRGQGVIIASSRAAPISFTADGREKTENTGGQTLRVRATLSGQQLTISSLGGETDYTVIFNSADNGKSLKVTRRITTDYLRETVFVDTFYTKTDAVAGLGIDKNSPSGNTPDDGTFSSNDPNDNGTGYGNVPAASQPRIGEFIVPNGTIVTGILDNEINTRISQNNDRFRMTVQSPDEFRGATVEGYISGVGRSGQVSGRSNITFNFERITLRDGKAYDFAGFLQNIKDTTGKNVKVDAEGTAKGDSQTRETAVRGGIGAGLGAIIGAIAGGGKGAAIGAIIGGGAGAGSVVVQGRDDVQLQKGSSITVQSSSPLRNNQPASDN